MKEKKTFCFDIDNTICNTNKNSYKKSKEKINKIKIINKLHDNGYKIVIYTARCNLLKKGGMGEGMGVVHDITCYVDIMIPSRQGISLT